MIYKFYIKSSVIQSYEFTIKFDFTMDLNGFEWIFWIFMLKYKYSNPRENLRICKY